MALKRINKKAVEDIVTFAWQASQSFVIGLTGAEILITSLGFQTVAILSFQLSSWVTYWIQKYHSHLQKEGYAERSEDSRKDYRKFTSFYP